MGSRRQALAALAALTIPGAPHAQQTRRSMRIGFLASESPTDPSQAQRVEVLRAALRDHGYIEGRNLVIEVRWAEGRYDRLGVLAAGLVRVNVDAIVASGTKALLAAKDATTSIPIVMGSSGDPIALGVTTQLARPSRNITGWAFFGTEIMAKLIELLKEVAPRASHVAYLTNVFYPTQPTPAAVEASAKAANVPLTRFAVRTSEEVAPAFDAMRRRGCDALVVQGDTMFAVNAAAITRLALVHRLPSASSINEFAEAGGLITYGPDRLEGYRRAAVFIDRLGKGAKVADLPIEQATKFELVINVTTAKTLGLVVPPALAARARLI